MAGHTIGAGFVEGMARYALSLGIDERSLFAGTNLCLALLSQPELPISLAETSIAWGNAVRLSGDPAFSLHLGEATYCSSMSIIGMIGESGATLQDALAEVARFAPLVTSRGGGPVLTRLEEEDGEEGELACVEMRTGRSDFGIWLAENHLSRMVTGIRRALADEFSPTHVRFQHPRPDYASEYERIFAAPVLFDQATNCIVFRRELLSSPLQGANAYLNQILHEKATSLLGVRAEPTFAERVAGYLKDRLRSGSSSADACAEALGMSRPTLHRKLKLERTSFSRIVDETRKELALRYLAEGRLGIGEIAALLGFAESSSFHRAFKRWTGATPSRLRG